MRFIVLIAVVFLSSCVSIIKQGYNIGQKFSFTTQTGFFNYLVNEKDFEPNQILFLDSVSYMNFANKVLMTENPTLYIGSYLNDSVAVKKSAILKDGQACQGRMQHEVERNLQIMNFADSLTEAKANLSSFNFYYLNGNNKFRIQDSNKKLKIFFLYYYAYGTMYDKLYKEMKRVWKKNIDNAELYIICIDPLFMLKKQ